MIKTNNGVVQRLTAGIWLLLAFSLPIHAESSLDYFTDKDGHYNGPSLEDQVALMDHDHNGFADVFEVRAYLEKQHGKGYQKELLDKWESSAAGKSCSTPFAKELYSDSNR
jgi:hypothetical protein